MHPTPVSLLANSCKPVKVPLTSVPPPPPRSVSVDNNARVRPELCTPHPSHARIVRHSKARTLQSQDPPKPGHSSPCDTPTQVKGETKLFAAPYTPDNEPQGWYVPKAPEEPHVPQKEEKKRGRKRKAKNDMGEAAEAEAAETTAKPDEEV